MKLIPYHDRVIFRKVILESKTAGGIILSAEEVKDNRDIGWGEVVSVGAGKYSDGVLVPMQTEVGDLIAFNDRQPLRFHYKGEYLYVIRESDIIMNNKDEGVEVKNYAEVNSDDYQKQTRYLG